MKKTRTQVGIVGAGPAGLPVFVWGHATIELTVELAAVDSSSQLDLLQCLPCGIQLAAKPPHIHNVTDLLRSMGR